MKLIFLLFVTCALFFGLYAEQPYLHVNLVESKVGMFSVMNYVAGVLNEYDTHPQEYAGIKVDFEEAGLYYESTRGTNWWQYYFEPINYFNVCGAQVTKTVNQYIRYAFLAEIQLERQRVYELIQKYIKIRPHIQEKVDHFIQKNFLDSHVIAVHYRGTDKVKSEAHFVPYTVVSANVEEYIKSNKLEKYKIFVASDEQQFIDYMQKIFSDRVITYDALRSTDGKPLHYAQGNSHPYQQGEEALIECILLSRGNVLIKTSSNLSLWSSYFNPTICLIELSQRASVLTTMKMVLNKRQL